MSAPEVPDAPSARPGNPLLTPSPLPYGLPPFAGLDLADVRAAVLEGMAVHRSEVDAIVADHAVPTFENTVVALERSGRLLHRAQVVFSVMSSALADDALRAVERELSPLVSAHADSIRLDPGLFARIDAVHASRHGVGLDEESVRLVERYHLDFVLSGAQLDDAGRDLLRALNHELSELSTTFGQHLQLATEAAGVLVGDVAELDGLSPQEVEGAAQAAAERGHPDAWLLTLRLPSSQPELAKLRSRALRERLFRASVDRASAGEHDNGPVAVRMARLRAERARLLGFDTHADLVVADQTARTSAAVDALLARLVGPSVANAGAEGRVLAELAAADGVELEPWDWAFYAERVRAERYAVDTAALRPWFELDRVLVDGVFHAARLLYGYTFTPRPDLTGYHPDVRVWEVSDAAGAGVGLYLGDFFARDGKRGGAWMSSFVSQSTLLGERPVVFTNLNVTRPAPGRPALLTLDEVTTLFHEFGHALHGLSSAVTYPRFSGTSVPRDFVEYPSQVNEMWALWPEVLGHYARHVETGDPLPEADVAAIEAAALWGEGFATLEYLGATLLDQAWHRITPDTVIEDAQEFERQALTAAGVWSELVPPRYRTTYFQHVFAGGYSAGYYSYIWSEVLDADTVEWFKENGGLSRANGDVFRARLLSKGGAVDPLGAFRAVRGRDADPLPLLRRRGLAPA